MNRRYCTWLLLGSILSCSLAQAGHEGEAVSAGPVTALEKLQSLKQIPGTPVTRRPVAVQHWQSRNGARVYFVEAHELPMLDVRLVFDAGAARDGDKGGLAATVNRMLEEGTSRHDASAIARGFESVGAQYDSGSYRDMAVAELRVLSAAAYREPALDLFADVVAHPQFSRPAFARIMQSSEIGQQQQEQSPAAIAGRLFYQSLYGKHPYAQPPTGTRASLARITPEDLRAFHQRYYVARNLTIAVVGDISRGEAEALSEKISAALPAGEMAAALPAVVPLQKARTLHQEFPSSQTHILIGATGIAYGDADYYALTVGNEILGGGGFTARLMKEIRQKRGLTYGVYSGFTSMHVPGPFSINLSTRSEQATEALKLSRQLLAEFIKNGPTENEVAEAKAGIAGSFPLSTASNASIIGMLGAMGFYGLPLDYLDDYVARIQAVTPAQIRAAFQRHLDAGKLLVVTVGQGKS